MIRILLLGGFFRFWNHACSPLSPNPVQWTLAISDSVPSLRCLIIPLQKKHTHTQTKGPHRVFHRSSFWFWPFSSFTPTSVFSSLRKYLLQTPQSASNTLRAPMPASPLPSSLSGEFARQNSRALMFSPLFLLAQVCCFYTRCLGWPLIFFPSSTHRTKECQGCWVCFRACEASQIRYLLWRLIRMYTNVGS